MKKYYIPLTFAAFAIVLSGCGHTQGVSVPAPTKSVNTNAPIIENDEDQTASWRDIELQDASTGENFKISNFQGKKIFLESFAVWCPTCLKQQKEIKTLEEASPGEFVHISIDTDPNESTELVAQHQKDNGLDWLFAVSPAEMTQSLIDAFGLSIVNAPGAPVLLICEDQSARLLKRGVKSSNDLQNEALKGC